VSVIGAHQWQREELTRLLNEKYGIPPEIISYGAD
jgi:hypothetical protein